ncbi:hypothetical protein ACFL60_03285 [Candidatus Omnitrophota bacterium]
MWRLLKAEFSYYRYNLYFTVIAYILFVCGFIVCSLLGSGFIRYHHIIIATWIPAIIATLSMLHSKNTAKRDRIFAILPVSPVRIALARVLYAVVVWAGLVFFFWLIPLILKLVEIDHISLNVMIFLNGNFMIINALYFISEDARYCTKKKTIFHFININVILIAFFNTVIIFMWFYTFSMPYDYNFGLFMPYTESLNLFVFSVFGLLVCNMAGLVLSYLSVRTYRRRKSYII